jgi:hypothetical protein
MGIPLTTSHAFVQQYPKLSQAMVDACVQALEVVQSNYTNANFLYTLLPSAAQQTLSLGSFTQTMSLFGDSWAAKYNNGTFPLTLLNDTVSLTIASGTLPVGTTVNLDQNFSNKYVIQAYKDLGKAIPTGPQNGPASLPSAQGKPSQEMAAAYAVITGQPAPANSGPAPMGAVITTTTSASSTSTSS